MLEALDHLIQQVIPDKVLVYGDTNSTLAGALAAAKLHVPVAHVEAGLRSFNRHMPEEINRVVADHVATWLFAPTQAAVANLGLEGRPADSIFLVGDVMFDAALLFGARPSSILQQHNFQPGGYVLATLHRAENTDDPQKLQIIIQALSALTETIPVVVPLHPRCRLALERQGLLEQAARTCRLLEPQGYVDMMALEKNARLIATDSGGVQKEAFFHGVPCVTLRAETEWVELVQCGWNRLAPPHSAEQLTSALLQALADDALPPRPDLYGQGRAAERIVSLLSAP
jgi:UDP-GlcNAc3NAcA epimerase